MLCSQNAASQLVDRPAEGAFAVFAALVCFGLMFLLIVTFCQLVTCLVCCLSRAVCALLCTLRCAVGGALSVPGCLVSALLG